MSRVGAWKAAFLALVGMDVRQGQAIAASLAEKPRHGPGKRGLYSWWKKLQGKEGRRQWSRRVLADQHRHERAKARLARQIAAGQHEPWLARCRELNERLDERGYAERLAESLEHGVGA